MNKQFKNLCWYTTNTSGTADLALSAPLPGFALLAPQDDGQELNYLLRTADDWEIGVGTFSYFGNTLSRLVVQSSTGGKINCQVGSSVAIGDISSEDLQIIRGGKQQASSGEFVLGLGLSSLNSVSSGSQLLALGPGSLVGVTSGSHNSAIGINAGQGLQQGQRNLLLGNHAGKLEELTDALIIEQEISNFGPAQRRLIHGSFDPNDQHLSPGVDDQTDLGIATRRWRNVHLSGSLTIDQAKLQPSPGVLGLTIQRTSTTQLTIQRGTIHDDQLADRIDVDSPMVLDLTEPTDFVHGAVREVNRWYHVLVGKSGGAVVAALSTTLAKPATWDRWQMLGAWSTDNTGQGQWTKWEQLGDWFRPRVENFVMNSTSPGSGVLPIRASCPPGKYEVAIHLRAIDPLEPTYAILTNDASSEADVAAYLESGQTCNFWIHPFCTDTNGQIFMKLSPGSTTFIRLLVASKGFRYPRGEAGYV